MLKALELAGFKSFADRTRFDFPDGITVIVGPNGSGKSNIVDAIKWVLGSQSAKSLRGKEMSDVIFKGAQGRGPAGTAEATIIFDNTTGALPIDTPEVRVTRRVFRSGEGEYLINNQPCRLKDVKDLIRGTGIGIDAYSLIEQGKVDRMLQANAKERRAIFEEAAGISRFKAKKIEAERRLARVQQNLVRLGDIVDEVATRLQSLKSQASKAERYRQATERLKDLRTQLAWNDWLSLSAELEQARRELGQAEATVRDAEHQRDDLGVQRQRGDGQVQQIAEQARQTEQQRSELQRTVASLTGQREADTAAANDLRVAMARSLQRLRLLQSQTGSAASELRSGADRLRDYRAALDGARGRLADIERERTACETQVSETAQRRDALQRDHLTALRDISELESAFQRTDQHATQAERTLTEAISREQKLKLEVAEAAAEVAARNDRWNEIQTEIGELAGAIELARVAGEEHRRTLNRRRDEIAALKVRLQGVTERVTVLEDLQRRQEGVSGGVRSVLEMLRGSLHDDGPLTDCLGIIADLFQTDVHVAPLIDAVLGDKAQYVAVRGGRFQQAVVSGEITLGGRIGLIRIDELPPRRPGDRIRLDALKGVIGRADRLVQTDRHLQPLAKHLLGTTWLVDNLATAIGLRRLSGAGLRFVTSRCELLEPDGSVVIGPPEAAAGLVSRRSELTAAHEERKHYRFQLRDCELEAERLAERLDQEEAELGRLEQQHRALIVERAGCEANRVHATDRLRARNEALATAVAELGQIRERIESLIAEQRRVAERRAAEAARLAHIESETQRCDSALTAASEALREVTSRLMSGSVEVARAEQKVEAITATIRQQQRDQTQREAAVEEVRVQRREDAARCDEISLRILGAGAALADLALRDESLERELLELAHKAAEVRAGGRAIQKAYDAAVKHATEATQTLHQVSRTLDTAMMRRQTLAERLLEDYEIDLETAEPPEGLQPIEDRDAVEEEIQHLRAQLQKTGSVNMEALEELQTLQARYDELHGQYQDLTAAKDSLHRVIGKINAESRRLFVDTLEAIRLNFQRLYRKSFGGGTADLILEDSDDPLEAGVEIIATPPGKPSFNNSLLSGGEKALTAVSLLMAIFQFRPSPFCVLDEVDAPFDEANIGRFVTVLNEFLDNTKFVVVTHSKKTMTAATTLYGVTMQESGISKQVSIRFEDVSDDGEISTDAA